MEKRILLNSFRCFSLGVHLRNMMGPHYSKDGENYAVGPQSYGLESEGKHFVRFGMRDVKITLYD